MADTPLETVVDWTHNRLVQLDADLRDYVDQKAAPVAVDTTAPPAVVA